MRRSLGAQWIHSTRTWPLHRWTARKEDSRRAPCPCWQITGTPNMRPTTLACALADHMARAMDCLRQWQCQHRLNTSTCHLHCYPIFVLCVFFGGLFKTHGVPLAFDFFLISQPQDRQSLRRIRRRYACCPTLHVCCTRCTCRRGHEFADLIAVAFTLAFGADHTGSVHYMRALHAPFHARACVCYVWCAQTKKMASSARACVACSSSTPRASCATRRSTTCQSAATLTRWVALDSCYWHMVWWPVCSRHTV